MTRVTGASRVSRRMFLGLAVATVPIASACTAGEETTPTTTPPPTPTTEGVSDALRSRVAEQEAALLARYDATLNAHPGLASTLVVIADQHREHRRALLPDGERANSEGTPTPPPIPEDPTAAVAELIAAERAAAEERTDACEKAADSDLARLLALLAASEAGHAEALTRTSTTADRSTDS